VEDVSWLLQKSANELRRLIGCVPILNSPLGKAQRLDSMRYLPPFVDTILSDQLDTAPKFYGGKIPGSLPPM
jgi:hypothetical protein